MTKERYKRCENIVEDPARHGELLVAILEVENRGDRWKKVAPFGGRVVGHGKQYDQKERKGCF